MRILVISDTHGKTTYLNILAKEVVGVYDRIIHLGDSEGQADYIKKLFKIPLDIVSGNCDFFSNDEDNLLLKIGNHNFLITHGHLYRAKSGREWLIRTAKEIGADYVLYGHTHTPIITTESGITLANPGSLTYPRGKSPSYIDMIVTDDGEIQMSLKYLG